MSDGGDDLLHKVLAETLAGRGAGTSLDEGTARALRDVARAHLANERLDAEVGTALVLAILEVNFGFGASRREAFRPLSRRIAQTLLADEPSRLRLERTWASLREEVR